MKHSVYYKIFTFRGQLPASCYLHLLLTSAPAAHQCRAWPLLGGEGHETVTLQAETQTPRRRTLVASFVRERTPPGELPLGRRKRLKAESSARSRARCRLDPEKHDQYLVTERARKTLSRGVHPPAVQYGPWRQKACERMRAERDRSRAEQVAAGQHSTELVENGARNSFAQMLLPFRAYRARMCRAVFRSGGARATVD